MVFEEIYAAYWQKVFRLCMGYVHDQDRAKDIAQETFITVWQQLPRFRGESAIGTWVFRIAANQCLRQLEQGARMPFADFPPELPEVTQPDVEGHTDFLYQCISRLPEIDRIIISLELEGVPQREIAGIIGFSAVNIRVRIHRVKGLLTQKFKQYER